MDKDKIKLKPLTELMDTGSFQCADEDITDFLKDDALGHQENWFAWTTLMIYNEAQIVNYLTVCCDSIMLGPDEKEEGKNLDCSYTSFPAMKIARLGTHVDFERKGLARDAVEYCIGLARSLNNPEHGAPIACRFLTVDAYPDKVSFWENMGFVVNRHGTYGKRDRTTSMRYDILPIVYKS